ncbi:MAG TPA: monovalent cation/H+ antiporter complex subunit F [Kiritimatiellia bacterium]|nr:monovalent cation/H+ antiporter complex subunit F [Kiritimatiellia bacterium]HMO99273.1 monovalent cation/H+ antiporter complex subunit F [Kiritimatiellia bacterium]HMP97692.1 monovalent cation/H+ antiporter complex subunit F [Kiritimatiellia bacterium]
MNEIHAAAALFLMLNLLAGLFRIYLGPTPADRLLATQLLGTTGTGILLILAVWQESSSLIDAALIFALLAAVTLIAFVCRLWTSLPPDSEEDDDVVA